LDTATILAYIVFSLHQHKIPFFTDWYGISSTLQAFYPENNEHVTLLYFIGYSSFILYFSFIFSIWGYFAQKLWVKWVVLFQFPFRLLSQTSTIPFFLNLYQFIFYGLPVMWFSGVFYLLFGVIEVAKIVYLLKLNPPAYLQGRS